jgi:uncharacterized protein YecE (DUF72 family)
VQQELFGPEQPRGDTGTPGSPLRIGTSGYSFPDWVGPFYPKGTSGPAMLDHYARHFNSVEINSSYYRIPAPRTLARMAEKTPADFQFLVKLHQDMTHKNSTDRALYAEFKRSLAPLRESGKLRGLLAQFPWGFRKTPEALRHIAFLGEVLHRDPLNVEFRRDEWDAPDVLDYLRARGIGYCCVDEPALPGLMPQRATATSDIAYLRFHGRNSASWWGRGGGDRYDYDYSEQELREWLGRIRELAQKARQVYVFFNNCHAGHAASNAMLMRELLRREGLPF